MKNNCNIICVLGATATGKTELAANLAYQLDTEIISADSRQVYKDMDIGTGKDIDDFYIKNKQIPYHLINILEAGEKYNVYRYQKDFLKVFADLKNRNKVPIIVGGSGLYIEAVLGGFKLIYVPRNEILRDEIEKKEMHELIEILKNIKKTHNVSDSDTKKRIIRAIEIETYYQKNDIKDFSYPEIKAKFIGIKFDRKNRRKRITKRLKKRLDEGMIEEVQSILKKGIDPMDLIYYGLEYKFITLFLLKKISYNKMFEELNIAIHRFAKRQMTWFRRMEKQNYKINWIDGNLSLEKKLKISNDIIS
ncbi:MAG: tRNA (adenosine(37)-N6)-dimethylallyltransferase MiaA [Bacteroidetes bacterium 4572_128]|nr:MAG: tRNA (adenosine(37)-N6)-dimethylallyltransferase MiaA [Bacteroidetes bacterium 4572_128]